MVIFAHSGQFRHSVDLATQLAGPLSEPILHQEQSTATA